MMTPWFPVGVYPVYDGVYCTRHVLLEDAATCWFLMRWHGGTWRWYSADSSGALEADEIGGGGRDNRDMYQWRGMAQRPNQHVFTSWPTWQVVR